MPQLDPFLIAIGTLGVLVFIVSSMLGMGFSLTVPQILTPLKNTRLVLISLAANFIVVPILALSIARVVPLSEGLQIGLILVGMAAGAPFLPKLVQVAKGDMAFTAGLMVLLMVATVIFLPLVLPFVLSGVQVSPWDIAKSLILLMLIPLALALFVRARYEEIAIGLTPTMTMATNLSLAVTFIGYFVAYFSEIFGVIGTGGILAAIALVVGATVAGFLLGGKSLDTKKVLALGTGQRNLAAAFAIATSNFAANPDVLIEIMVVSLIGLVMLMLIAGELGRRSQGSL
ncbi:MAG: bile acid:sodium symporter family protein [Methanotrichaceae archaeon]|nr:bile acid:sodium symporter family protein [Methanotrichaceae archaeon]